MDTAKMIMVDLRTFEELSAVIDQLLHFVGERDANAAGKLSAIVKTLTDIYGAITEGNVPEVGPIFDAINEVADEVNEALDKAKSAEEMVAIVADFNHFHDLMQQLLRKRRKKTKTRVLLKH